MSIENVSDYIGLLFKFIMKYGNQQFRQYPTLTNSLTILASTALHYSPLCSNEDLDYGLQGAIERMTTCLRLLKEVDIVKKVGNTTAQIPQENLRQSMKESSEIVNTLIK
ncbi:MAG: hypothetical protein EZS28_008942 [Streblomastix strix]|uniref:Uncharacterized protein n=1 Tax=Streblomastix strix TaxID=222440 RepID=A0A5J4WMQ8_9EUKA|nr:MAG: hypothetical protein EZS28_008942 [Streblomastix strix]